jgi:hypothetical protein
MAKKLREIGGFTKVNFNYRGGGSVDDMRPEEYKKAKETSSWELELWNSNPRSGNTHLYVVPFRTDSDAEILSMAKTAKKEAKNQDRKTFARVRAEKEE